MIHRIARAGLGLALILIACTPAGPGTEATPPLPSWTFTPDMIFPADQSLLRAEDGVALPDGRVVVTDQAHGLRAVSPNGTSRPFGQFAEAGYQHQPPEQAGGANGASLEPGGTHILMSDVFRGAIYDPATDTTQSVFRISTPESEEAIAAITARREAGEPWLQLMAPTLWSPAPGLVTGMILSPGQGPVYLTGLGNALIRLDR
jgi:hypothetical protein